MLAPGGTIALTRVAAAMVRRLRAFFIMIYGCRNEIEGREGRAAGGPGWWAFETFWLSNLYVVGDGSVPSVATRK